MLDWVWSWISNWLAMAVTEVLDFFTYNFLSMLSADMTLFGDYFPFAEHSYVVFQYTAYFILGLIFIFQLLRIMAGPILGSQESPATLLLRTALSVFCITFARDIFNILMELASAPFDAMLNLKTTIDEFTLDGNAFSTLLDSGMNLAMIAAMTAVGLGALVLVVMLFMLGFNFLKVLMEAVTRYIVLCVLCYTSPLAFATCAAKSTQDVFRSWCRMVGSQLLLLVLNVWFVRGFNAAVGMFIQNLGATENGDGTFLLWFFCMMAFLQVAQRIDSYLAQIGMSAAQTGAGIGMEMLMTMRAVSQITGGMYSGGKMGSAFKGPTGGGGAGGASGSFGRGASTGGDGPKMSNFKAETYRRDAATTGNRAGLGGIPGMVARGFGAHALAGGQKLSADAVSSVASGRFGQGAMRGKAADNSLANFMPDMNGMNLSGTQIEPGHISTTAADNDGNMTALDMYDAATHEAPDGNYGMMTAEDGSRWYVTASGANAGSIMSGTTFDGTESSADVQRAFPTMPDGTSLRTVEDGVLSAVNADGSSSMLYSAGQYEEPKAPHSTVRDKNGMSWYQMAGAGKTPSFTGTDTDADAFRQFMPGYPANGATGSNPIASVDASSGSGKLEVRHADGSATRLFDSAVYGQPGGDYATYQDANNHTWYGITGTPTVVSKPIYQNGQPVMENGQPKTVRGVETRYYGTPRPVQQPQPKSRQGKSDEPRHKRP